MYGLLSVPIVAPYIQDCGATIGKERARRLADSTGALLEVDLQT